MIVNQVISNDVTAIIQALDQLDAMIAAEELKVRARLAEIENNREMVKRLKKGAGQTEMSFDDHSQPRTRNGRSGHGTGLKQAVFNALAAHAAEAMWPKEVAEWVKGTGFKAVGKNFNTSVRTALIRLAEDGKARGTTKDGRVAFQYAN